MSSVQFLAEWALRSSILILTGALFLKLLRVKDASVRLAAWTAILVGSLAIPAMSIALPVVPVPILRATPQSSELPITFEESVPAISAATSVYPTQLKPEASDWPRAALIVYIVVALALLLRLATGLAICQRLLRRSRKTEHPDVRESDCIAAPVTLGVLRPVIVFPTAWREWDTARLDAVLAHERSHIMRHDPAVQLLSAIHRSILWLSPLSWALHQRLVSVAEEASDDAAVIATGDRTAYAEILLDFIRHSTPRANLAGVPMARYGNPDKRIHRILDATSLSRGVTRWSAIAILALASPLAYIVATAHPQTVEQLAQLRLQPPPPPPAPPVAPPPAPQPPPAPRPKFDVASIRPCDPNAVTGGRGGPAPTARFRRECVTVKRLISDAYVRFFDGNTRSPTLTVLTKIEGGPAWLDTDQYTIEAESDAESTNPMKAGPMMQALLEDRFQLKIHRETRQGSVYDLTAAKGGSKVQPAKVGPCVAADLVGLAPSFRDVILNDDRPCRLIMEPRIGPNTRLSARGVNMEDLTTSLTGITDRLVIDKTGIKGDIDFHLTFATEENTAGVAPAQSTDGVPTADDPPGPSIFTALEQQLGLKLEPARGAREYLVIDSISRPSEN